MFQRFCSGASWRSRGDDDDRKILRSWKPLIKEKIKRLTAAWDTGGKSDGVTTASRALSLSLSTSIEG
uniref:Uncharacterized protein n=1 Tax=Arundo donax TaxID=35708 RepID=A0A0A9HH22_ARUDO